MSHSHGHPSHQCTDPHCRHAGDTYRHPDNCDPDPGVPCPVHVPALGGYVHPDLVPLLASKDRSMARAIVGGLRFPVPDNRPVIEQLRDMRDKLSAIIAAWENS